MPKEDKMKKVIFSQTFPEASPQAMLNEAEELSRNATDNIMIPPFEEMLRRFQEDYTWKPRPGAARNQSGLFPTQ